MAITSPNLGLKQWNGVNDLFNHTELSNNFGAIDLHDHTGGPTKGLQIPTAGITNLAVTTGKLADLGVTTTKIADGNVTTAKLANASVSAAKLGVLPHARVFHNVNQSIASGISTFLTFNSERYDTDNIHDNVDSTKLTCRTSGLYMITASIRWSSNATGHRALTFVLNNSVNIASTTNNAVGGIETEQTATTIYRLAASDFLQLRVSQTSGAALDVVSGGSNSSEFAMTFLSNFV